MATLLQYFYVCGNWGWGVELLIRTKNRILQSHPCPILHPVDFPLDQSSSKESFKITIQRGKVPSSCLCTNREPKVLFTLHSDYIPKQISLEKQLLKIKDGSSCKSQDAFSALGQEVCSDLRLPLSRSKIQRGVQSPKSSFLGLLCTPRKQERKLLEASRLLNCLTHPATPLGGLVPSSQGEQVCGAESWKQEFEVGRS